MPEMTQQQTPFQTEYLRREKVWVDRGPSWLSPIRKAAIARFEELGLPTTRHEEWRYTNVGPLADTTFTLATEEDQAVTADQIVPVVLPTGTCHRLVLVNGRQAPALCAGVDLPSGLTVTTLADALENHGDLLQAHLTQHANYKQHPFVALNTAFIEGGAVIHVPRGTVCETPIHIVHVTTSSKGPVMTFPRTLIVAEAGSQVSVIETYAGLTGEAYFSAPVTEIVAAQDAIVDHYRLQREGEQASHISFLRLQQDRSSNVTSHSVALGGSLVRNDVNAVLDGEGAECTLNGLTISGDQQHVDNHLRVEHAQPYCNSWEYYKNILADEARGVFTGRIVVRQDAQKTDAKQTNMNLLLSDSARIDTKPQLEIFADDVKCTHGATIGQVDRDAIFYLRSRGIAETAARNMLIHAFAGEMLDQMRTTVVREQLERELLKRLPQGHLLGEVA